MLRRSIEYAKGCLVIFLLIEPKLQPYIASVGESSQLVYLTIAGVFAVTCFHSLLSRGVRIQPESVLLVLWIVWVLTTHVVLRPPQFLEQYGVTDPVFRFIYAGILAFLLLNSFTLLYEERIVLSSIVIGGVLLGLISMLQGVPASIGFSMTDQMIADFVQMNANTFSYLLLLCFGMGLFLLLQDISKRSKVLIIGFLILATILIILSASRKIFFGEVFLLLLYIYVQNPRAQDWLNPKRMLAVGIMLLLLYQGVSYVIRNTSVGEQVQEFVYEELAADGAVSIDERFAGRGRFYVQAAELLQSDARVAVTGIGLGAFGRYDRYGYASHSEYISLSVETGLIGFILYFGVYVVILFRIRKTLGFNRDPVVKRQLVFLGGVLIAILLIAFGRWNYSTIQHYVIVAVIGNYSAFHYARSAPRKMLEPVTHSPTLNSRGGRERG